MSAAPSSHDQAASSDAVAAFAFLTFVAVSKTLLTEFVFTHVNTPVAFSVLSCIVTMLMLLPIFAAKPSYFGWIRREFLPGFIGVSAAIAVDLGCTNVAISELSIAMQQTIKATSPAATVVLEVAFSRKCHHPLIFFLIAVLCVGSILVKYGSTDYDATVYGIMMMSIAVVSGAFKYVMAHAIIRSMRKHLGVLAFTFWIEMLAAAMLTPWAILNGEAQRLLFGGAVSTSADWALLLFTGAYGGVRILSQFALLKHASAVTLALSNVAIQALTGAAAERACTCACIARGGRSHSTGVTMLPATWGCSCARGAHPRPRRHCCAVAAVASLPRPCPPQHT